MSLTPYERASIITRAIEWKFGQLLAWERPDLAHTFGANDLDLIEEFEKRLANKIDKVRFALGQTSDTDLVKFQSKIADRIRFSERDLAAFSMDQVNEIRHSVPPPIAYGFGHPVFAAKFCHWSRMPELTLHEVSFLSLGANPTCMKDSKFTDMQRTVDNGEPLFAAYTSLLEQREIFKRCFSFTGPGYWAEGIANIKGWIDDLDIQVHPQFYAGLIARTTPKVVEVDAVKMPASPLDSKGLTEQETETLFKLIAAMSIKGYAFIPEAKRNQATADIQSDLDQLGISLDPKTILKWVRIACDVLPKV